MSLSSKPPLFSLQLLALGLNRDDAALIGRRQVLQKYRRVNIITNIFKQTRFLACVQLHCIKGSREKRGKNKTFVIKGGGRP